MRDETELIDSFIATFTKLDELWTAREIDPIAWQFTFGDDNEDGFKQWKPIRVSTEPAALESLYTKLPARFPPLYEKLILSYRWAEVDLGMCRLLANPLSPKLEGLLGELSKDKAMQEILIPNKCLQFGKGPDLNYDAVCFDFSRRLKDGDCPIVQIDHEAILSRFRFKKVKELAPSFRDLMLRVIEQASDI